MKPGVLELYQVRAPPTRLVLGCRWAMSEALPTAFQAGHQAQALVLRRATSKFPDVPAPIALLHCRGLQSAVRARAGEPVALVQSIWRQEADIVTMFPVQGGRKFLIASREGKGRLHRIRGRGPRYDAQGQAGAHGGARRGRARSASPICT